MLHIDIKYLLLISSALPMFTKKSEYVYNFRCIYCHDSKKKATKARGYAFRKGNDLWFKCHNCGIGKSMSGLIKTVDPELHKKYLMEKFLESPDRRTKAYSKPVFASTLSLKEHFGKKTTYEKINLPSVLQLEDSHWVREYVKKRQIPFQHYDKLYFAEDFKKFIIDSYGQDKAQNLLNGECRLVIPFFNEKKQVIAVQGRSLLSNNLRYITIKVRDEDKIFGLDRLNTSSKVYVVEGPLDSLFLNNCIAVGGAELTSIFRRFPNAIYIFDNEPWNAEIKQNMKRVIANKGNIVIWPTTLKEKDINDMFVSNLNVEKIIEENTYSSLEANAKFAFWSK